MPAPDYHTLVAETLSEALRLLQKRGAIPLAGGTDILVRIRKGWQPRGPLVVLEKLDSLRKIRTTTIELIIGALCTHSQVATSALVHKHAPLLAHCCQTIGSVQIRNRGTIGGNIINASPAADTLPALYVYEGRCELRTSTSRRIVPIEKLLSGPGKTKLRRGELLVAIRIPLKLGPHRFDYQRLAPRRAVAIAKVSVAVVSVQQKGHIKDIRIAFGAVAPTVVRARQIEKQITTDRWPLEDELLRKLVQRCVRPIDDIRSTAEYRQKMCTVLLKRALSQVLQA